MVKSNFFMAVQIIIIIATIAFLSSCASEIYMKDCRIVDGRLWKCKDI